MDEEEKEEEEMIGDGQGEVMMVIHVVVEEGNKDSEDGERP